MLKTQWIKCILSIVYIRTIAGVGATPSAVELMINVDAYDDLSATHAYGVELFGPDQIRDFFAHCRQQGVSTVFWRSHCQIASYHSKLNYNISHERDIRSNSTPLRYDGAFAARVGVRQSGGGIFQSVATEIGRTYTLNAYVSAPSSGGVYLWVLDQEGHKLIKKGDVVTDTQGKLVETSLTFIAPGPVQVMIASEGHEDISVFVVDAVSLKDEEGKELIRNGSMEEFSMLVPTVWDESTCSFLVLNGDIHQMATAERERLVPQAQSIINLFAWQKPTEKNRIRALQLYDPLKAAVEEAHKNGVALFAWLDPLDDGRRMLPGTMANWSSRFLEDHPEYRLVDKNGRRRWGQLCFGYPQVRQYKNAIINELLDYGVDGIYLKLSYQHCIPWDGNTYDYGQFVYNDVALKEYEHQWGVPEKGDYDIERLKAIQSNFFLQWIQEASDLVRARGKKLVVSMNPSERLDLTTGDWPFDWRRLIRERSIDIFLLEPRRAGDHKGFIEALEERYHFAELCRRHSVHLAFDYYLMPLAMNRLSLEPAQKDPKGFFSDQLYEIARNPISMIGIYEGLFMTKGYWPPLGEAARRIQSMPSEDKITFDFSKMPVDKPGLNVAYAGSGGRVYTIKDDVRIEDPLLNDGRYGNLEFRCYAKHSPFTMPFTVEVQWPSPASVSRIRIYSGVPAWAHNPSGDLSIKSYQLQGRQGTQWMEIGDPVESAPNFLQSGELTEFNFFLEHCYDSPLKLDAVRIVVKESHDTGLRLNCMDKPCVSPEDRSVCIREIEIYASPADATDKVKK